MKKHKRRPNGPPGETLEEWGYRTARETGYDAGNLRGFCKRVKGVTIDTATAKRWADEARRTGMKLYTTTTPGPWRTSAGHTITETEPGRYRITAPGWDHPVRFTASTWLRTILTIEKHLGPVVLYVNGKYENDRRNDISANGYLDLPVSTPAEESEGEQVNAFDPIERPARRLAA